MAKEGSVAPKERINVTFRPTTGGAQEEIELPLKLLTIGDYTQRVDERKVEERKPISVDKMTFDEVLSKQELRLTSIGQPGSRKRTRADCVRNGQSSNERKTRCLEQPAQCLKSPARCGGWVVQRAGR